MKWAIWFVMLVSIGIAHGIVECQTVMEPSDIPCRVTSTWNYTAPCESHNATVYDMNGNNTINYTFQNLSATGLCYYTWNISEKGIYVYITSAGDSGNITIEDSDMILAMIIGIGIIVGLIFWFAFSLDESHNFMKVIAIITGVTLLTLIPYALIGDSPFTQFYKSYLWFVRIFWIYVFVYISYQALVWLGLYVPKERRDDG